MSTREMVRVEDLVKVYPGGTRAVDGITFTVSHGDLFGFLGPNGAGKSTTMKVLSTLLRKTSGTAVVAGHDVDREQREVRRAIGFAMQDVGLDDLSTGRNFLVLQGVLYGMSRRESRDRAEELLDLVELTPVADRRVGTYSGGMRRRIDLVAALMHRPSVLFLDEPTTGLDPQGRLTMWDHLEQLNRQGITILLTTQMMEEAQRLCRRIAIIDEGKIVAEDTPDALRAEVGGDVVRIAVAPQDGDGRRTDLEAAERLIADRSYVEAVSHDADGLAVRVENGGAAAPDLLALLHDAGFAATNLSVSSPTLDDVFLNYTGHSIRNEDADGDEAAQMMRPWLGLNRR